MVTMGNIWDRTTDVLAGRSGILTRIAALFILLPSVVQDAFAAYSVAGAASSAAMKLLIAIAVLLLVMWGQLAILAVASDPATDFTIGVRFARRRLGAAVVVTALLVLAFMLALVPLSIALVAGGIDVSGLQAGSMPPMSPRLAGFILLYSLLMMIAILFIVARLTLTNPVVLREGRSIGAIRRSITLTRNLTWRLIGVLLLFIIVVAVATGAAQLIAGVVFRITLGDGERATVQFLANVAGTIVTTIFTVVAVVFSAQLYLAVAPATGATEPA